MKELALEISASAFGLRVALFYMGIFSIYGIQMPYLPVWLEGQGLSVHQIGYVIGIPFFFRLFLTPLSAVLADYFEAHRTIIILFAFLGLFAISLLTQVHTYYSILGLCCVFLIATSSILPLTDTIAVMGGHQFGLDYGRMRLWGSLSFAFVGLLAGYFIERFGFHVALYLLALTSFGTLIATFALPKSPGDKKSLEDSPQYLSKVVFKDIFSLFRSKIFFYFLLAVSLTQASHAVFYTFGVIHLQKLGYSGGSVGFIWAFGVLSEVLFFAFARQVLGIMSPTFLMFIGGFAAFVRWFMMSLDPPFFIILFLQILHALTFGATHLGAIRFISETISSKVGATAQALQSSFAVGIAMGLATAISGTLYANFSSRAFLFMSGLGLMSMVATFHIYIQWDRQKI